MEWDDALLADVLATYLLQQKYKIDDTSVGPMAINLLVALERYRISKDINILAQELWIPEDVMELYKKLHEKRKARDGE